jgi:hypothetical protein
MKPEGFPEGWIPYRMLEAEGQVKFRWLFVGEKQFTEPFFEESIAECLSLRRNEPGKFPETTAEELIRIADTAEDVNPTAFIYHISRCGSTLIAQVLSCDTGNIVLSEVPLLDDILQCGDKFPGAELPNGDLLYRAVVKLMCRNQNGSARVFIKGDSWHVLFFERLRAMYPEAHAFLLYRAPEEVAASHRINAGMHAVPGLLNPALFNLTQADAVQMNREEYVDHVLNSYLEKYKALLTSQPNVSALSYHSGM